jgi:hypothetical protein
MRCPKKIKGVIKMKKIGIVVFALMFVGVAYAGAQEVEIDFDGKSDIQDVKKSEGFTMPEDFLDIEYNIPVPKRVVKYEQTLKKEAFIPVRIPVFTMEEVVTMDKSIDSAIAYVKSHKQGASLVYSFEYLKKHGTPQQKFSFVYGKSNLPYEFPKNYVMKDNLVQNKGIVDDVLKWVCKTYVHLVTYYNCDMVEGEYPCDAQTRKVFEESCDWE